jgi:hypothetical protein
MVHAHTQRNLFFNLARSPWLSTLLHPTDTNRHLASKCQRSQHGHFIENHSARWRNHRPLIRVLLDTIVGEWSFTAVIPFSTILIGRQFVDLLASALRTIVIIVLHKSPVCFQYLGYLLCSEQILTEDIFGATVLDSHLVDLPTQTPTPGRYDPRLFRIDVETQPFHDAWKSLDAVQDDIDRGALAKVPIRGRNLLYG